MKIQYYENLICLVVALEKINKNNFIYIKKLLECMVWMLKSGVNELLNIGESIEQFGPPYKLSLFQFEEINRKIMSFLK